MGNLEKEAKTNVALLASAQQRVQKLLEDYVTNLGNSIGKTYNITWKYLDGVEKTNETDATKSSGSLSTE